MFDLDSVLPEKQAHTSCRRDCGEAENATLGGRWAHEAPPVGRSGLGAELEQQRRWTWAGWALKARLRFRSFC